jgi:hypothetical protein
MPCAKLHQHPVVTLLLLLLPLLLLLTFSSFPAFRFFWAVVRLPRLIIFLRYRHATANTRSQGQEVYKLMFVLCYSAALSTC